MVSEPVVPASSSLAVTGGRLVLLPRPDLVGGRLCGRQVSAFRRAGLFGRDTTVSATAATVALSLALIALQTLRVRGLPEPLLLAGLAATAALALVVGLVTVRAVGSARRGPLPRVRRALVVGSPDAVTRMLADTRAGQGAAPGLVVTGAMLCDQAGGGEPVQVADVLAALDELDVDVVVPAGEPMLPPCTRRVLAERLAERSVQLLPGAPLQGQGRTGQRSRCGTVVGGKAATRPVHPPFPGGATTSAPTTPDRRTPGDPRRRPGHPECRTGR